MSKDAKEAKVGSVFDLPEKSWQLVKKNWQMFAVVNILSLLSAVLAIFSDPPKDEQNYQTFGSAGNMLLGPGLAPAIGLGIIVILAFIVASIFLLAMSTSLELRSSKNETPSFDTLFQTAKKFWLRQLGLFIVMGIIITIGLILLIVPGIYAIGRLIFAPYLMFDKDLGIVDSLKASANLTKGNAGPVWAAIGLTILFGVGAGIIGAFPVIGELLSTLIMIAFSLIIVLRYRELKAAFPGKAKPADFVL